MFPTNEIYLQAELAYRRDRITEPRGRPVKKRLSRRVGIHGHPTRRPKRATISPGFDHHGHKRGGSVGGASNDGPRAFGYDTDAPSDRPRP